MRSHHSILGVLLAFCHFGEMWAQTFQGNEFYEKKVRPLLHQHCLECHGSDRSHLKGGLDLGNGSSARLGGDSGVLVGGESDGKSLLIRAIGYADPDLQMPPKYRLTISEQSVLEKWVRLGLPSSEIESQDGSEQKGAEESVAPLWSALPLGPSRVPPLEGDLWSSNPIDRFILEAMNQHGLSPASPADPRRLIRRMFVDALGVPPSPKDWEKFVGLEEAIWQEKLVSELLGRGTFGERWARHWLDVVRYTETAGHVQDLERPYTWLYRDYVIRALNADHPYDEFLADHLIGDLLGIGGRDRDGWNAAQATGFLWFHEMHFRPVDPLGQRADQVDAQVDVISKAFLGLTVSCSRCHDHKFDPISQKDYYALAGVLHNTEWMLAAEGLIESAGGRDPAIGQLQQEIAAAVSKATGNVRSRQIKKTTSQVPVTEDNFTPAQRKHLMALRSQLSRLSEDRVRFFPSAVERGAEDLPIHIRGDHKNLGAEVSRGFLSLFVGDSIEPVSEGSGRKELVSAMLEQAPSLLARVAVNRVWQHYFGRGIVTTLNNFGFQGARPTHPAMLDYLARYLIEHDWSLKSIHRLILTSRTYQLGEPVSLANRRIDPENQYYSYRLPRRMDAESLRDSILAVSGMIDWQVGGESVPPYVSPNVTANKPIHIPVSGALDGGGRRSVYIKVRRNFVTPFLQLFDFPNQAASVALRDSTLGAKQSLALLNSPFVHQQSAAWAAARAVSVCGVSMTVEEMFEEALGRSPRSQELELLVGLYHRAKDSDASLPLSVSGLEAVAHTLFNLEDFLFVY
jgi:hypothetical protein